MMLDIVKMLDECPINEQTKYFLMYSRRDFSVNETKLPTRLKTTKQLTAFIFSVKRFAQSIALLFLQKNLIVLENFTFFLNKHTLWK